MSLENIKWSYFVDIYSGRENGQEKDHEYNCILKLLMSLIIFDVLIYHWSTFRDLENHPCSFSVINVKTACEFYSFHA